MASASAEPLDTIRDAASIILVDTTDPVSILMGRRLHNAVFMPNRYVFPGGAVDPGDAALPVLGRLSETCRARLADGTIDPPERFAVAALRELWEETGLCHGEPAAQSVPGPDWAGPAPEGYSPSLTGLSYIFRAITPPGQVRRFDARFFLCDAARIVGDRSDFSGASGELGDLAWVPVTAMSKRDMADVTRAVLDFVVARLPDLGPPPSVPLRA